MSGFHRMITYLYLYEQGTKSRNIGFAKIERREQCCLLEIHMKNTGCSLASVPAYLYVQQGTKLAGILLGNFALTRGSGDFKAVIDAENLKDSGYRLDDVKGIHIPLTAQMMSVSQWDDDEFDISNFVELAENKASAPDSVVGAPKEDNSSPRVAQTSAHTPLPAHNTPSLQAAAEAMPAQDKDGHTIGNETLPLPEANSKDSPDAQNPASAAPAKETAEIPPEQSTTDTSPNHKADKAMPAPKNENGSAPPKTVPPISVQKIRNNANPHRTLSIHAQLKEPADAQQDKDIARPKAVDALKAVEALPRPANQAADFRSVSGKNPQASGLDWFPGNPQAPGTGQAPGRSQAEEPENWDLRWRFILENYPVMTPFAGDGNTLCVRMELKDLRQLPKQFWYLGNNSFLLHGFFNYRYFILGMTEEFGVKKWFVGIPGIFQNPERVMAALFGFPEFRSEKPSPINTGEFGYWYRYLNELSEPSQK